MSDATLPSPPRSSSAAPTSEVDIQSDSTTGEGDPDTSLIQPIPADEIKEGQTEIEGKADNKQKRKRTRYAAVLANSQTFSYPLLSTRDRP